MSDNYPRGDVGGRTDQGLRGEGRAVSDVYQAKTGSVWHWRDPNNHRWAASACNAAYLRVDEAKPPGQVSKDAWCGARACQIRWQKWEQR